MSTTSLPFLLRLARIALPVAACALLGCAGDDTNPPAPAVDAGSDATAPKEGGASEGGTTPADAGAVKPADGGAGDAASE
jgi:hypothetical protein